MPKKISELTQATEVSPAAKLLISQEEDGEKVAKLASIPQLANAMPEHDHDDRYFTETEINDKLTKKVDYDDLDAYLPRSMLGSPLAASSAAAMTDTTKIYVYVGSESGYTAGNWYYHDGTAWVSGGVYNSDGFITDPTLSIFGMAADAKAVGDVFDSALKLDSFHGRIDPEDVSEFVLLENQPPNTFCRLYKIVLAENQEKLDTPDAVDVLLHTEEGAANHYAWLYTTGGENRQQFLFDASTTSLYHRYRVSGENPETIRWTDWCLANETAVRQVSFIGETEVEVAVIDPETGSVETEIDPITHKERIVMATVRETRLAHQPVNTVCRLYKIQMSPGQTDFDAPDGVNVTGTSSYYAWMFTVGGIYNKMQLLIDAHTKTLYFRFFTGVTKTRPTGWTDWFTPEGGAPKKKLNILVIGNSFDQDTMAYVPPILNELLPDYDITYCVMYKGSSTIADHITMFDNNTPYPIRSIWLPGRTRWSRDANAETLKVMLAKYEWDVICLNAETDDVMAHNGQTATYYRNAMINAARTMLRKMQAYAAENELHPFSAMWFEWMARPYPISAPTKTAAEVYEAIHNATKTALLNIGFTDSIPVGAAFQDARTNATLNALGTYTEGTAPQMLFSNHDDDVGVHMQAGLPALLAAYTVALKMLEWSGNRHVGLYGSAFVPDDETCHKMNALSLSWDAQAQETHIAGLTHGLAALGSNGTKTYTYDGSHSVTVETVTADAKENIRLVQEIAVKAVNHPDEVLDCGGTIQEPEQESGGDVTVSFTVNNDTFTADTSISDIAAAAADGKNVYAEATMNGALLRFRLTASGEGLAVFGGIMPEGSGCAASALFGFVDNGSDVWVRLDQAANDVIVTFTNTNNVWSADTEIPDIVDAAAAGKHVVGIAPLGNGMYYRLELTQNLGNTITFGTVGPTSAGGSLGATPMVLQGTHISANNDYWQLAP